MWAVPGFSLLIHPALGDRVPVGDLAGPVGLWAALGWGWASRG